MNSVGAVTQLILLTQRTHAAETKILIEPTAPFEFAYTRVRTDTAQAVWRWPSPEANAQSTLEPVGQIVDLAA